MVRGSVSYVRGGPDPGQGSDVAHCAQNFKSKCKIDDISVQCPTQQRATAEEERTRTKTLIAGRRRRGGEGR
jgi:hypothetical protein